MRDGTEGLRVPPPQIDMRILRHMLLEATDLLDESAGHAAEGARCTQSAMALTRAHWLLMSIYRWITEQLEPEAGSLPAPALTDPVADIGIDDDMLSQKLRDYAERVDRLYARTRQLQTLTGDANRDKQAAAMPPEAHANARVLNIFGDPDPEAAETNPVHLMRDRLSATLIEIQFALD